MDKIIDKITNTVQKYRIVVFIITIISIFTLFITLYYSIVNTIDYISKIHSSDATVVGIETDKKNNKNVYEIEFYDTKNNTASTVIKTTNKHKINDSFKVYYLNPDKVSLTRKNPIVFILFLVNLVITILLILVSKKLLKVDPKKAKILQDNFVIFAYIEKVTSKQVGKKLVYNINFSWFNNEDRKTYTFVSKDLKEDPTMSINLSNKNGANIHLDRNNYDNYIIDLDELINNKI